jgi:hypothetical protein
MTFSCVWTDLDVISFINNTRGSVISGFQSDADKNCALLGYEGYHSLLRYTLKSAVLNARGWDHLKSEI